MFTQLEEILAPGGKDEIEKACAEEKRIAKEKKTFSWGCGRNNINMMLMVVLLLYLEQPQANDCI